MTDEKRTLVELLRRLSEAVSSIPDSEFRDLALGNSRIMLSQRARKHGRTKPIAGMSVDEIKKVVSHLQSLSSREDGLALLDERCKTKTNLMKFARVLDLPVDHEDTVEKLRDKIVEATIGFRLRSEAIRGNT
jgi:hypothetical protein